MTPPLSLVPFRALLKAGYSVVLLHRDSSKRPFRIATADLVASGLEDVVDLAAEPPSECPLGPASVRGWTHAC